MKKLTRIVPAALALGIAFGVPATAMAAEFTGAPITTIATLDDQARAQIQHAKPDFLGDVGPAEDRHIFSYGYKFYGTQKSADAINAWVKGSPFSPTGETELGTQTLTLPSGQVVKPGQIVVYVVANDDFTVARNATVK
ncbi:hypothetical protein [Corynebacterium ulcerans]|uniref:Secreted protein n=1 Tax=Corynebacterium ulcerans TaxID=65058 RepID=A0ABD0BGW5_CORUL|nr:hypothetical protein [Corynebacterium ulcerans]AEG82674.1 putative secreted protein [Corynebacterium ulcerans 809]AIU31554.1 Hypothetical protein Cul210931_2246 [Corynebacterium ulcerans]AIU92821.1 Hypothetical protein Cul05146_2286 [Corynebacterium ulcerans]MBH5297715.1 hypothetical protein [Corynebacterium ulcerans]NOL62103.1 hypothetical protein [Corynebacterium ulcerans]